MRIVPCILACCCLVLDPAVAGEVDEPRTFAPGTLPNEAPTRVLPVGAAAHVQLTNGERLLAELDDLVMSAVPPSAVPDPHRPLLDQPEPTLAFLGIRAVGMPLTKQALRHLAGIDASRPVTCTVYPPMGSGPAVVVSVPVADHVMLSAMLFNLLGTDRFETITVGERTDYLVRPRNPDLPGEVVVSCSEDRLYLSTARPLAAALGGGGPRLADSPLIVEAEAEAADSDLCLAVDLSLLHEAARRLAERYPAIPAHFFQGIWHRLSTMRPAERRQAEFMLHRLCGIGDLETGMQQLMALSQGIYGVLRPALLELVTGCDGLVLSAGLAKGTLRQRLAVYGSGFRADTALTAVGREDLERALALTGGDGGVVMVHGRAPAGAPSALWRELLASVRKQQERWHLSTRVLDLLLAHAEARRTVPALAEAAPWMLYCSLPASSPDPGSVEGFVAARLAGSRRSLVVLPGSDLSAVIANGQAVAAAETANAAAWRDLRAGLDDGPSWLLAETRFRSEEQEGRTLLTTERSYRTTFGLLGASQHELINRTVRVADVRDGLVSLEAIEGDAVDLPAPPELTPRALQPAERELLALVPEGANRVCLARSLPRLPEVLDAVGRLEALLHAEVDAYNDRVAALYAQHRDNERRFLAELRRVEMPQVVEAVVLTDRGPTARLIGGLVYPRPRLQPLIAELFAGVTDRVDSLGGAVAYSKAGAGSLEIGAAERLDGCTALIRTLIANWIETYGRGRESTVALQLRLRQPGDGSYHGVRVLLVNPSLRPWVEERLGGGIP